MNFKEIDVSKIGLTRFLSKVSAIGDSCHEWTGCVGSPLPYGLIAYGGSGVYAHRVSYLMFRGNIPHGKVVCHTCDNPRCVRPSHLFLGTQSDNVIDSLRKHRSIRPRGVHHPRATLSETDVRLIRSLYAATHSPKKIAQLTGFNRAIVGNVVYNTNWKHVAKEILL